jgi:hypothetical protein
MKIVVEEIEEEFRSNEECKADNSVYDNPDEESMISLGRF